MHIKVLGSGQEVGRSAILLEDEKKIFLDFGVKIEPPPPKYPPVEKVDAAIISHSHLDHVGAAPLVCKKGRSSLFMNDVTLELGTMLIKDSIKVAQKEGYGTPFTKKDLKKMIRQTKIVRYNERFKIGGLACTLWPSGHIPGSSSTLIEGKKRVFYTSDIQTTDSHLLQRCKLPQNIDTLIVESTYGQKNHTPRDHLEGELIKSVEEALANNEVVLLPVFAVGRAQEVMMVLEKFANKIAIDGMVKLASEIIAEYGSYLRDPGAFRNILKKVHFVHTREERAKALSKYPVIISSAGMLGGGPAVHYLREISHRKHSKVLFTGFLVEDTPGRTLLDTGKFKNTEEEFDVQCELRQFGLSAHTDRRGIFEIIKRTNPKQVLCVHGEHCKETAKDIAEHFGIDAHAPKNGEKIKV